MKKKKKKKQITLIIIILPVTTYRTQDPASSLQVGVSALTSLCPSTGFDSSQHATGSLNQGPHADTYCFHTPTAHSEASRARPVMHHLGDRDDDHPTTTHCFLCSVLQMRGPHQERVRRSIAQLKSPFTQAPQTLLSHRLPTKQ